MSGLHHLLRVLTIVVSVGACSGGPPAPAAPAPTPRTPPPEPPGRAIAPAPAPATHDIALGARHGCAIREGALFCWGAPFAGPSVAEAPAASATRIEGLDGATAVAIAGETTCAVRAGAVWCFGDGERGGLGDGTTEDRATPGPVPGLSDVVALSGDRELCAVRRSGEVACWGGGPADGVPRTVAGLPSVVDVAVGSTFGCALDAEGVVWCWGQNESGQLGDGTSEPRSAPVRALDEVRSLSAGSVACARRADDTAWCWGAFGLWMYRGPPGAEGYAELGCEGRVAPGPSGSLVTWCPRPFAVPGATDVAELAVGGEIVAARRTDGTVVTFDTALAGPIAPMARHEPADALPLHPLPAARDTTGLVASGRRACGHRAADVVCFGHAGLGGVADSAGELGLGERGVLLPAGEVRALAFPPAP